MIVYILLAVIFVQIIVNELNRRTIKEQRNLINDYRQTVYWLERQRNN